MERGYAERYARLYREHWWWRVREETVLELLGRLPLPNGATILDVGCGDALFFSRLAELGEVEGVESDTSLVSEEEMRRGRIHGVTFDCDFDPGKRYGLILMLDVLEHLDSPIAALVRARELLVPGGWLVITVPAFECLWTAHDDHNRHRRRYRRAPLVSEIQAASLEVEEVRYLFHWTFPAKVIVRAMEKARGRPSGAARVPPAAINRLIYLVTRLESRLLGPLRLPFGSSLLVAARHLSDPRRPV